MTRAVVDPGVLVSGLISSSGAPARLLDLWIEGAFELIVCPALLAELEDVLARPKLAERIPRALAQRLLEQLHASAILADDPGPTSIRVADPDDAYLVSLLADARADVLVSGDRHLTDLAPQIPVVTPRQLLAALEG